MATLYQIEDDDQDTLLSSEELARSKQLRDEMEMDRLAAEAERSARPHLEHDEVLIERWVDKFTANRDWVPIVPSLCIEAKCGFDAARAHGFNSWDEIPVTMEYEGKMTMRQKVLITLERHKKKAHPSSGPAHLRTKAQAEHARQQQEHRLPDGFVHNPSLT